MIERAKARPIRLRRARHILDDVGALLAGVLDARSFVSGYRASENPVEIIVRRPHDDGTPCTGECGDRSRIKAIRRTHNLRTKPATPVQGGTNQQANAMGFVYANANASVAAGTSTAMSATQLTDAGQAWAADQWRGMIVVVGSVYGVITTNDATHLTVDKWHNPNSADSTGTTPGATSAYFIVAGAAPAHYIGLSDDATAPAATDTVLAAEISTNGLARALGTYSYVDATPAYQITHTWTATATQSSRKAGMFNASAGGVMWFENTFGPVTLNANDTLQLTWTVSI